jgi:hypothetical protein
MSLEQWLQVGGFLIVVGGVIWGAANLKSSILQEIASVQTKMSERISAEVLARTAAQAEATAKRNTELDVLRKDFHEAQRAQDHNFGEMGAALRRFIETVEKDMREIEIWGRDHYVQRGEFEKATESIRSDIKELGADIKSDIRERIDGLSKRIDGRT